MVAHGRITISDVAREAGVSNSAVSYAFNGRPGVSKSTRKNILAVAHRLGWQPNRTAQSLSSAHSRLLGLVLDGDPSLSGVEPYFMKLISGITQECEKDDFSLVLRRSSSAAGSVPAISQWIATGAIDGLILTNVETDDPRLALLAQHPDFPVVAVTSRDLGRIPVLKSEEGEISRAIVERLEGLGHRTIARVSGPARLSHTRLREEAFVQACARKSIRYRSVTSDYTPEGGREATAQLISGPERPTAIIYDNDVMALAGLVLLRERGIHVPQDLSLVCWDDSILCTTVTPTLTAVHRDTVRSGRLAASMLIQRIHDGHVESMTDSNYEITVRESTGPAPAQR